MKHFSISMIFIVIMLFFLYGCENDFSPTGNLKNDFATYCVLDSRLDQQFVLVQKLYLDKNSIEKLQDVKVVLSEYSGQSYPLKDTIINGLENFNTYYLPNYKLKRDLGYRLTIMKDPYPTQWSDTYIEPSPLSTYFYVSQIKYVREEVDRWRFIVYLPRSKSNPCSVKMFIKYTISNFDKINSVEVPIKFYKNKETWAYDNRRVFEFEDDVYTPIYPSIMTTKKWDSYYNVTASNINLSFDDHNILYALIKRIQGDPNTITIIGGYIVYYTIDATLYDYFIATGQEAYSVRLDEPFVSTNFKSTTGTGYGYFGSVTADTTTFNMDPLVFLQFGFKDGQ